MNDMFEFLSSSPMSSAMPSGSPPGFGMSSPFARDIPSLERDFCSNFACCGLRLNDLHELLDHFEESHIMVVAADGTRIYPDNRRPIMSQQSHCAVGSSSSCSSPLLSSDVCAGGRYSSLVLEYPQPRPSPPSSWSELPPPDPESQDKESNETAMDEGMMMQDFDAFEPDVHNVSVAEAQTEVKKTHRRRRRRELEAMGMPPSSFTVPGNNKIRLPAAKGASPKSSSAVTSRGLKIHDRDGPQQQQQPRAQKQQHAHTRRRDKMFKCPRSGCTKEYLNPNGLKYHLEKGTCTVAEGSREEDLPAEEEDET